MSDEIAGRIPAIREAEINPVAGKDRPDLTGVHLRLHVIHQKQETTVAYVIPAQQALRISESLAREARTALRAKATRH